MHELHEAFELLNSLGGVVLGEIGRTKLVLNNPIKSDVPNGKNWGGGEGEEELRGGVREWVERGCWLMRVR